MSPNKNTVTDRTEVLPLTDTSIRITKDDSDKLAIVIPTYNASSLVNATVDGLLSTDADRIVICDDNSTDDTVDVLRKRFGSEIELIQGRQNLGAGGNRNRSLKVIENGNILFMDVDTEIIYTESLKELISKWLGNHTVGAVGFGILDVNGRPMKWNFGDLMNPIVEAEQRLIERLYIDKKISFEDYVALAPSRAASKGELKLSQPREVGWVAEGCFATSANVLRFVGGFPEGVRYHEAHFIGKRYARIGKKILFDPIYFVRHLEHDVRDQGREEQEAIARSQYYKEFWGMPETATEKLFEHESGT